MPRRFPLRVAGKSRTPEDHYAYYRWLWRVAQPQNAPPVVTPPPTEAIRVVLWLLDRLPTFVWRRLPLRLRNWHLFTDFEG